MVQWGISNSNLNLSNSSLGTARPTGTTRLVCPAKYRSRRRRTSKLGLRVLDTYRNSTHMDPSDKAIGTDNSSNRNRNNNNRMDINRAERG